MIRECESSCEVEEPAFAGAQHTREGHGFSRAVRGKSDDNARARANASHFFDDWKPELKLAQIERRYQGTASIACPERSRRVPNANPTPAPSFRAQQDDSQRESSCEVEEPAFIRRDHRPKKVRLQSLP
jgi:hypothetical protein